jgi:hypothetical protein
MSALHGIASAAQPRVSSRSLIGPLALCRTSGLSTESLSDGDQHEAAGLFLFEAQEAINWRVTPMIVRKI